MSAQLRGLHDALIDILVVMNSPRRDAQAVRAAGLDLDRALFPLLIGIERKGPVGVVHLAEGVGRDYTTVSRQVAKLEELGLVKRRANATDKRIREAEITAKGKAMTETVDASRERTARKIFEDWSKKDVDDLVRLMRKFADGMLAGDDGSD